LGSLAGILLLAGGSAPPARADSIIFNSGSAAAQTALGESIGAARVQLTYEEGSFRHGGKTWAGKYSYHVEFDSLDEAYVTSFQASGCGLPYSLDSTVGGKTWHTIPWVDLSSRLPTFSTGVIGNGIPAFGSGEFTGYSNAITGVGTLTVRGLVMLDGIWQEWSAEITGHTMGCDPLAAPPEPKLKLGISLSKAVPGTGQTIAMTLLLSNEGGAAAENVLLRLDPLVNATYKPKSSTGNGEELPDVDGQPAVINGGVVATVEPGDTVSLAFEATINEDAGGKTLALAASAALEGFPTETATASAPIVRIKKPNLGLTLGGSPSPVGSGENLTVTAELKNTGDGDANDVKVTLDAVAAASGLGGTQTVSVPAGGSVKVTWSGKVADNAGGQTLGLTATAALEASSPLTATASVPVFKQARLALSLGATPSPVGSGDNLTVTAEVRNTGDGDANGVQVTLDAVAAVLGLGGTQTVNVPAGGSAKVTWSGKVANNAGGQTLAL
jgi:hypothetical protein